MNKLLRYGLAGILSLYSITACSPKVPDTGLSEKNNPFVEKMEYNPQDAFQDYEQKEPASITGTVLTSYFSKITTNTSDLGIYQVNFTMIGLQSGDERLNLVYPGFADLSGCSEITTNGLLRFKPGTEFTNNKFGALLANEDITFYEIKEFDQKIQGPLGDGYVNGLILKDTLVCTK